MEFLMNTILAIGAHYDDIEIGVAGTLYKYALNGHKVYFAITNSDEFRTGSPDDRYREQIQSLKLFGLSANDLMVYRCEDDESDIIGHLDNVKADILFCPFECDTHQSHRRCSIIGQAVGRSKNITTFFYAGGSTYNFDPNVYNIIDFDKKSEILKCFSSQIAANAIRLDTIEKREAYWGTIISNSICYAEGFIVSENEDGNMKTGKMCMNDECAEKVLSLAKKAKVILEWGSGGSTVAMSRVMGADAVLYSYEHDGSFYKTVSSEIDKTKQVFYVKASSERDYVYGPSKDIHYSFILVDGIFRQECLKYARETLSWDILLLHDAERERYKSWMNEFSEDKYRKSFVRNLWICEASPMKKLL